MKLHPSHNHRCPSCNAKLKWAFEDFQFVVTCDHAGCRRNGQTASAMDLAMAFQFFLTPESEAKVE